MLPWDKVNGPIEVENSKILTQLYSLGYSGDNYGRWYLRITPMRILNGIRYCIVESLRRIKRKIKRMRIRVVK